MGATDASHNPSGHSYLVLLQIGGQDELDHGALLSATSRFVSYPGVVSAMKAYLDGYATRQRPYAPLTLAIGTNNDVDVSASAGISWARNVVGPVVATPPRTTRAWSSPVPTTWSRASRRPCRRPDPGWPATCRPPARSSSSTARPTAARPRWPAGQCNNGWTMADLQWLSGGAAPSRTISLPQIYNYAMPLQWKYISLTGIGPAGRGSTSAARSPSSPPAPGRLLRQHLQRRRLEPAVERDLLQRGHQAVPDAARHRPADQLR